jgi:hypothetical protein
LAASIVRRPLVAEDVGPSWIHDDTTFPPGGGGCRLAGCAIQAENYSAILDPDSDGNIWTKVAVTDALGGQVIKAPNGSTASPSAHETLATYEMVFETPGTYTAYYRVRGFNGSTDSFFAPDTFGVDPDNTITTSQNAAFIWKKDTQTFSISPSNVGMPLEFRLGMREQQAELDALVLNLSSSLTSTQLDDLFAVLPGDYNGDGVVAAADYVVWRTAYGQQVPHWSGADGNGDGIVDDDDFQVWTAGYGSTAGSGAAAAAVPEPASVTLVFVAFAAICARRGRFTLGSSAVFAERHGGS